MTKNHDQLRGEVRYAIRLCQRTARLYRHIQTAGTFFGILGGSAAMASLSNNLPHWLSIAGGAMLAIAGAALIAIRPADKAAQNEQDVRRYQSLMTKSLDMTPEALEAAIEEARQSDAPEVDALRNVAYNDVVKEINRDDQAIPLSATEKIWQLFA